MYVFVDHIYNAKYKDRKNKNPDFKKDFFKPTVDAWQHPKLLYRDIYTQMGMPHEHYSYHLKNTL